MFVDWNNAYSVKIDMIDDHHRHLIDLLNSSYLLIVKEGRHEQLSQLLEELVDYARYHFSAEEELMRQHQCHQLDQHLIEHFGFINRVLSFRKELSEGKRYLAIEIFDFIKEWLLNHILTIDKDMGRAVLASAADHKRVS